MCLIKLLCKLEEKFWLVPWSNFKFRKVERHSLDLSNSDFCYTVEDIKNLARKMFNDFEYKRDGLEYLGDAICPPPYAYDTIKKYNSFKDDCDGFHSLIYHCLSRSLIECYLLTVVSPGGGHCVLLFKLGKWYVLDYTSIYGNKDNIVDAINEYNNIYISKYAKKKVWYNGTLDYNYNKGKFKSAKLFKIFTRR